MELKISKNSTLTIHVQLKEQIKGLILDEILSFKAQLPTVRQLGQFLQINKNTVSKVYKDLETEGYVQSLKGKGTFVSYKKDTKKILFLNEIEEILRSGIESGIDYAEILGMVYFKSHHLRFLSLKGKIDTMAIIECNQNSIDDFKSLTNRELSGANVEGILIDDLLNKNPEAIKKLKNIEFIVIPYIHFHEVDDILQEYNKEVFTFGINQSLKLLNFGKKMKNKTVGIISHNLEDEKVIQRQFQRVEVKEFIKYGGVEENSYDDLKNFLRKIDFLIIGENIEKEVVEKLKPKKPYIVFSGKYAIDDMRIIKDIFN